MKKLLTVENAVITTFITFAVFCGLGASGLFDGPPSGVVYGKHTEPPTKHCSVQYGKDRDDLRIQKMPVDAKFFISVYLNDGKPVSDRSATVDWEVPKYVYDNAEVGEIWDKP